MNVEDLLKELKDHYVKYVDNQLDLIETHIVQDIVKMLTWDFKIETSQVIQDFIINSKKCIQFLNLVQFVEKMDNIDTTQITQNLLKLFGYVKVVITNYIQGNIEYDQKRYIYTPKASKKDRDEGLEEFDDKYMAFSNQAKAELKRGNVEFKGNEDNPMNFVNSVSVRKNTHPTVKPTELMQYLVRLVSPNGATILDCFNGSGSTGKAVMYENKERNKNYKYIGIELTEEYLPIAKARIEYVCNLIEEEKTKDKQLTIFDIGGDNNE
jgi:DNA modification methylase